MLKSLRLLFIVSLSALAITVDAEEPVQTAIPPVQLAAQNTKRLLTSMRDGDRALFLKHGSEKFKEAMNEQLFAKAKTQLFPLLNRKSDLDYLGALNKGREVLYLYRLRPEAGGDDLLVSTAMRDGKVTGFRVN